MEVVNFIYDHVNFYEKHFLETIALTLLNTILWSMLPYLQYKYKIISKFWDDLGRAADFLAFVLIHCGTFRNYAFIEAIASNVILDFGKFKYVIMSVGIMSV